MTSLELIVSVLGSLSNDIANANDEINRVIFDIEALQRALMRLGKEIDDDK